MFENWPNHNAMIDDPLINYFLFALLCFYPLYRVSKRAGLPFWTACTVFIPFIGMVVVTALLAHLKWNIGAPKKTVAKKTKEKAGKRK